VATLLGSYANPAVALAAMFSGGHAGLSVQTALAYLPAEIVGATRAFIMVTICFPARRMDVRTVEGFLIIDAALRTGSFSSKATFENHKIQCIPLFERLGRVE
jgi:glycerol uptake facilitator-like aquaporin